MLAISYSVASGWKYSFSTALLISFICGSVIPIMYAISNKCRHHPATIILILCLLEMSATYQVFLDSVCLPELVVWLDEKIKILKIVEYYGFEQITYQSTQSLFTILCNFNQATMKLCILTELNYYIILTIDLILTLKKPFINPSKRMLYYNLCAFLATLILFFMNTDEEIESYCEDFTCNRTKNYEIHLTILIQLVALFIGAIIAIVFWCKDIKKSQQIDMNILKNRRTYFQNHMILLAVVFLVWFLPLISYFVEQETIEEGRSELKQTIAGIYFTLNLLNPCIFLYIRLREPYYRQRFLLLLKGMFSEDSKNKVFSMDVQDMCSEEWEIPLGQLISMQTNQETVSNILSQLLIIISYDNQFTNPHMDRGIQKKMSGSYSNLSEDSPLRKNLLQSVRTKLQFTLEIEISEFAPGIFQQMRTNAGIDYWQLQQSLRVDRNEQQIRQTQESMGKSGSFFFFSHDKRIVLKTISKSEFQFILDIVPQYYEYMQSNPFSYIAKFYGCFKVQIIGFSTIYLLMMENTLQNFPDDKYLYDLKGSLVNRYTNVPPSQEKKTTLKDRNFLESDNVFIKLNRNQREELFDQLKLDTDFLCRQNIMDYSFLVAVTTQPCYQSARTLITSEKSYCFSLIDFTQQFSTKKKIENLYKTLIRKKGSQISCIDPENYKRRFQSFLNSVIIIEY